MIVIPLYLPVTQLHLKLSMNFSYFCTSRISYHDSYNLKIFQNYVKTLVEKDTLISFTGTKVEITERVFFWTVRLISNGLLWSRCLSILILMVGSLTITYKVCWLRVKVVSVLFLVLSCYLIKNYLPMKRSDE